MQRGVSADGGFTEPLLDDVDKVPTNWVQSMPGPRSIPSQLRKRGSRIQEDSTRALTVEKKNESRAEAARREMMGTDQEAEKKRKKEDEDRKLALKKIMQADSADLMLEYVDSLIDEDWCGGLQELSGNVYGVMALGIVSVGRGKMDIEWLKKNTAFVGFWLIVAIQILGPPLMAANFANSYFQDTSNLTSNLNRTAGLEEWTELTPSGAPKKLLTLLFLVVFGLNGLFVHLDEKETTLEIDRVIQQMHLNSVDRAKYEGLKEELGADEALAASDLERMSGTHDWILWLGVFVNAWVSVWCHIDAFFVCCAAETISDLLMNSFALTFLYNLDDVGGDMGFVNHDDWPGIGLAWVARETKEDWWVERAEESAHVYATESSPAIHWFYRIITTILITLNIVFIPLLITTPIKVMAEFYDNDI